MPFTAPRNSTWYVFFPRLDNAVSTFDEQRRLFSPFTLPSSCFLMLTIYKQVDLFALFVRPYMYREDCTRSRVMSLEKKLRSSRIMAVDSVENHRLDFLYGNPNKYIIQRTPDNERISLYPYIEFIISEIVLINNIIIDN